MSSSQQNDSMPSSGPKPFSISFSSTSRGIRERASPRTGSSTPSSRAPELHRFQENDSDADDDDRTVAQEDVIAFDHEAGGAISARPRAESERRGPLVIKVEAKNNWQDRAKQRKKGGRSLLPENIQAQRAQTHPQSQEDGGVKETKVDRPSARSGLSYAPPLSDESDIQRHEAGTASNGLDVQIDEMEGKATQVTDGKPLSQDEAALQALILESREVEEGFSRRTELVIGSRKRTASSTEDGMGNYDYEEYDEVGSFRADVASRPESASLADYAAIPVEEFGAALLRGMGWKDGEPIGKRNYGDSTGSAANVTPHVPQRRPGYLGIGAKDIGGKGRDAELELGAWGKSAMRKAKKAGEGLYTPVMMRSKKTGKLMTEEEFKSVVKDGGVEEDEDRRRRDDGTSSKSRHSRNRDRDYYTDDSGHQASRNRRPAESNREEDCDRRRRRHYDDVKRGGDRSRSDNGYRYERPKDDLRDRSRDRYHDRDRDRDYRNGKTRGDSYHSSRPSSSSSRQDRGTDRNIYRDRSDRQDKTSR